MDPKAVLQDPTCSISSAYSAAKLLWGPSFVEWEPDTIRLSLKRQLGLDSDATVARIQAAVTVMTTNVWTYDHDVFFAIAVACCGVPADSEALHHPTPEQLCWAVDEIQFLTGSPITVDSGFDPATVDPAIAAILHEDGFVWAPDELQFAQEELEDVTAPGSATLRANTKAKWESCKASPEEVLRAQVSKIEDEALQIQIGRLANCAIYVRERRVIRAGHHASNLAR